ncbi:hypothetical protein [Cellulomonas cellasea]|nr:hypothetical protein [Cellulomonas cellasea]
MGVLTPAALASASQPTTGIARAAARAALAVLLIRPTVSCATMRGVPLRVSGARSPMQQPTGLPPLQGMLPEFEVARATRLRRAAYGRKTLPERRLDDVTTVPASGDHGPTPHHDGVSTT